MEHPRILLLDSPPDTETGQTAASAPPQSDSGDCASIDHCSEASFLTAQNSFGSTSTPLSSLGKMPSIESTISSSHERITHSHSKKKLTPSDINAKLGAHPPNRRTEPSLRRAFSDSQLLAPYRPTRDAITFPAPKKRIPNLPLLLARGKSVKYNKETPNSFASRIVAGINAAAICIMVSFGHKAHLFSTLHTLQPVTLHDFSQRVGLDERYVKEWMDCMLCIGFVEERPPANENSEAKSTKYGLTPEASIYLTWAHDCNLALLTSYIPALGQLEPHLVKAFREGTCIPESVLLPLDSITATDTLQTLGNRVPALVGMSKGLEKKLQKGVVVACIGGLANAVYLSLAKIYPRSWFTCYETVVPRMHAGREQTEDDSLTNVHFRQMEALSGRGSFDLALVFDAGSVREDWSCLERIYKGLCDGSVLLFVDMIANGEKGGVSGLMSVLWSFRTVCRAGFEEKDVSDNSSRGSEESFRRLKEVGFEVKISRFEGDDINCVLVARKGMRKKDDTEVGDYEIGR